MTRVAVIGAGLLGAAVADALAARRADVTVIESGRPGGGTSGSSFAWINAQDKAPAAYFELNRAGVAAHRELAASLGGDWYHPGGDLVIGRGEAAAGRVAERIERHVALGYPVQALDREEVTRLEPNLDLTVDGETGGEGDDQRAFAAALFPDEAWIDAPALVERLLDRACAAGARVLAGSPVVDLELQDGRMIAIVIEGGDRLTADAFVLAAGPASERLAASAGVTLPLGPTPGLLAATKPVDLGLAHIVHAGDVALRPHPGGRLLLSSRQIDAGLDPSTREIETDSEQCRDLLARARRLIPALAGTELESATIGVRSVAADGMPVTGFAPDVENLYLLVSHSGATLAPLLGGLVASELLGDAAPELDPYRPGRFA